MLLAIQPSMLQATVLPLIEMDLTPSFLMQQVTKSVEIHSETQMGTQSPLAIIVLPHAFIPILIVSEQRFFTETLTTQSVVFPYTAPTTDTYSWTDASGKQQSYTVNYSPYSYKSNFGCS